MPDEADIAIVGAGAAGLAAAIFAGEMAGSRLRIQLLDGAKRPGAKILVSGGGRCNVTNKRVTPNDFEGGPKPLIRNVLRAFNEQHTVDWMRSMDVDLKLEPTGKYFPTTDKARTVLDALLKRVADVGVRLIPDARILAIAVCDDRFVLSTPGGGSFVCKSVIIATGGLALPKSGSDGVGLKWLCEMGHTIIPTTPALAPLVLQAGKEPGGRFAELSGLTLELRLMVRDENDRLLTEQSGSTLFTHFGLSGPAPMNLSRHIAQYKLQTGRLPRVTMSHPNFKTEHEADQWLLALAKENPKRSAAAAIAALFPERLAQLLAGDFPQLGALTREQRRELARRIAALPLPVIGDRGYTFAEATAGGVDLREVDIRTMQSRLVRDLFLCGEVLDVDGRIGGFNFQWAWSSGYLAGRGAANAALSETE